MADIIQTASATHEQTIDKEAAMKGQAADEGYELFEETNPEAFSPEAGAAVRRKLDRHLLPLMCL